MKKQTANSLVLFAERNRERERRGRHQLLLLQHYHRQQQHQQPNKERLSLTVSQSLLLLARSRTEATLEGKTQNQFAGKQARWQKASNVSPKSQNIKHVPFEAHCVHAAGRYYRGHEQLQQQHCRDDGDNAGCLHHRLWVGGCSSTTEPCMKKKNLACFFHICCDFFTTFLEAKHTATL
jgi:hypothetical protein